MNCDIIKDLLPVYIDGLTSEASNVEIKNHLAGCADCSAYYENMQREIEDAVPSVMDKEIDFLKKIRRKNLKTVLLCAAIAITVCLVLIKLFVLGFAVNSDEMTMIHTYVNGNMDIEFSLVNGHDLIMWSEADFIYDENDVCIGFEHVTKPRWVFHNPFDDIGTTFSLGTSFDLSTDQNSNHMQRDIIRFKDKDVVFVNGQLTQ